ncbi:NUDIX hydrolase [Pyxidicoccus parkwayensis]|uniref:NUDIX hydrolase n=1 Tax=Pyxidicoccus parkwayensis TaxID=2813578 RepID=A0ABX7NWV5_9BACT|nr:NUDIX hydrolase [Pyxidicoccus parkwaysis]QSQ21952.1 NUDIX hydrolase [Pyxidicoccus parkwaysis]
MPHAYLAVLRAGNGTCELLLGQKNIFLPPHGRYQYAAIPRNALQYILPGGRVQAGESPEDAAVREFFEDTGVKIPTSSLTPLFTEGSDVSFFQTSSPPDLDLAAANAALTEGRAQSMKFNNLAWMSLEQAFGRFGRKPEYQSLPWVTTQIVRALNAGFSRELIGHRANESHQVFTKAVAHLLLNTLQPGTSPQELAASQQAPALPAQPPPPSSPSPSPA